jgi:hypothetical protein
MTTTTETELEAFRRFVDEQIKRGERKLSPEQSVAAFRAYQRDLERLQEELRPALERSARGEGKEIDWEEFERRGRERLAREGITD